MAYVVSEVCIQCKLSDCVEVCPVDFFQKGENILVIDQEDCIDCTLCEPGHPIGAIYPEGDLPAEQEMIAVRAELALQWPVITGMKDPPPDSREREHVDNTCPVHFFPQPCRDRQ